METPVVCDPPAERFLQNPGQSFLQLRSDYMRRRITLALSLVIIAAVPLTAQQGTSTTDQPATAVQPAVTATPAAARFAPTAATKQGAAARLDETRQNAVTATTATAPVTRVRTPPMRQSVALMIVGAAGLLVGSIIGGDSGTIIMVGSGIIGLYGLYQYLR
jgi:hypothetical protein